MKLQFMTDFDEEINHKDLLRHLFPSPKTKMGFSLKALSKEEI